LETSFRTWPSKFFPAASHSKKCQAIISPHAGYTYCGVTAKQGYLNLCQTFDSDLILLLGPSHFKHMTNFCALTPFTNLETPLGHLNVATEAVSILKAKNDCFFVLSQDEDELEHSLEMQYPLIKYFIVKNETIPILPILVGRFGSDEKRLNAARKLSETLSSLAFKKIAVIISSDFCHYGSRFDFNPDFGECTHDKIKEMDLKGFESFANGDDPLASFSTYLEETANTICGREAILLGIELLNLLNVKGEWNLLDYSQSNQAKSSKDSSVSYLSAGLFV